MATKNRKILEYQENAVREVVSRLDFENTVKFQAPTGSGKTLMTAMIVDKLINDNAEMFTNKVAFVFIAPSTGGLDHQGYEKINSYVVDGWVKGFECKYVGTQGGTSAKSQYLESIDKFEANNLYFLGWGILTKNSNVTKIDSEKNDLFRVIEKTREAGIDVVLIVDEAHREYPDLSTKKSSDKDSEVRKLFLESLNPVKRIEISATLPGEAKDKVVITLNDVRREAAIRQNVFVNNWEDVLTKDYETEEEFEKLISSGIRKIEEIENAYDKAKISIKPLMLIQIPDDLPKTDGLDLDSYYLNQVKSTLEKHGWTNKKYAVWMSGNENKTVKNKEDLTRNDSEYQALIFKQAIATGWDIPRACVLIKLRNPKKGSDTFEIQTLGRILRNPFFKYYSEEEGMIANNFGKLIDNAFVYTYDKDYKNRINQTGDYASSDVEYIDFPLSDKGRKRKINISKAKVVINIKNEDIILKSLSKFKASKNYEEFKMQINKFDYYAALGGHLIMPDTISAEEIIEGNTIHKPMGIINQNVIKSIKKYKDSTDEDQLTLFENKAEDFELKDQQVIYKIRTSRKDGSTAVINFNAPKDTLLSLYIKYRSVLKLTALEEKFFDALSKEVSNEIKKKQFYQFGIFNFEEIISDEDRVTWREYFNKLMNEVIKDNSTYTYEPYELVESMRYNKNITKNIELWDKINSYKIDLNEEILESEGEKIVYSFFKNFSMSEIEVFRNGINPSDSFYSNYFSNFNMQISKFFPDFIVTFKDKIFILEIKGEGKNDIDKNSDLKENSIVSNLKEIDNFANGKNVIFCRVTFPQNIKSIDQLNMFISFVDENSRNVSTVKAKFAEYFQEIIFS